MPSVCFFCKDNFDIKLNYFCNIHHLRKKIPTCLSCFILLSILAIFELFNVVFIGCNLDWLLELEVERPPLPPLLLFEFEAALLFCCSIAARLLLNADEYEPPRVELGA
jgi:hypothetical protein